MANVYVWSGAVGTGTGASWANAIPSLQLALPAVAAGDVVYIAHDHTQTSATPITFNFLGTEALPNYVYCVNRAGSVPPALPTDLRTTAVITTTSNSSLTIFGTLAECYGITFNCGTGTSTATIFLNSPNRSQRFVHCNFYLLHTNLVGRIQTNNGAGSLTVWENCRVGFSHVAQRISVNKFIWKDTSDILDMVFTGAVVPTYLLQMNSPTIVRLYGLDLTAITTGLVEVFSSNLAQVTVENCSLASGVALHNSLASLSPAALDLYVTRSDNGDSNWRNEHCTCAGAVTTERTIVRTGGASDGTTPVSWKLVTSAASLWSYPLDSLPITYWNENIGSSITVTIQGIWGGGAVPNNDDIWIEVEFLGSFGTSRGNRATSGKPYALSTATAISPGTGTWGGSTTKFALSTSFVPAEKGPITITVRAAKPSSTFYVDPKPLIS